MLLNTFLHIPGVGVKSEKNLWEAGVRSWEDFTPVCPLRLSSCRPETIARYLQESKRQIEYNNPRYFSRLLPAGFHWRLFPQFRNTTVYLDIETTGLDWANEITTIALYDGLSIKYYVNGRNLQDFMSDIERYNVIVSYNGKCFDIPFIERYFGISLDQAQIDLRYILASLGYRGGLKGCERQLGIDRGELKDIDGFFAVLLWNEYRNGNPKGLETLLAYNIQDVLSLEELVVRTYNLKIKGTPFESDLLAEPVLPRIPFDVDLKTVQEIRSRYGYCFQNFS